MAQDARAISVHMVKLAQQTGRYAEMAEFMKSVVQLGDELNEEERNLLSDAYKNAVGAHRNSWRILHNMEHKGGVMSEHTREYRIRVEKEMTALCNDIISILDQHLLVSASNSGAKTFYYKLKADYCRYIAELSAENKTTQATQTAKSAYEKAVNESTNLPRTDPLRLGVALNYSVFYYAILNDPLQACKLARQAFDDAAPVIDEITDEYAKRDATLILKSLKDNILLWESALHPDSGAEDDD